MPLAIEQIRRMRGGAQSHLMRCEDEAYYVVKSQNNPQGLRLLASELLAARLAARLGLPVPPAAVVEVREDLVEHTDDLVIELGRGREQLREVVNLTDFCGVLVFDKWTCNTNGRQAIFFRGSRESRYRAQMVDQGFCFHANEWTFPDAPLRGLYARHRVYASVRGIESFEPWLSRVESAMTEAVVEEAFSEIPPEWYGFDPEPLEKMLRARCGQSTPHFRRPFVRRAADFRSPAESSGALRGDPSPTIATSLPLPPHFRPGMPRLTLRSDFAILGLTFRGVNL